MSETFQLSKKDFIKTATLGIRSNGNIHSGLYEIKEVNRRPTTVTENAPIKPPRDKRSKLTLNVLQKLRQELEQNKMTLSNPTMGKETQKKQQIPSTSAGYRNISNIPISHRPGTFGPGINEANGHPRRLSIPRKTDEDFLNESLAKYSLQRVLGKGAYAVVRLALHNETGKKVAIKTYEKYQIIDPVKKNNLLREIEILKRLDHPNIVKLHETIEGKRHFHLVLEYINGSSLYNYMKSKPNGSLEESEARKLFKQILSALDYCHNQSVAHRDIKLDNILLDNKENVKLIDFGFSTLNSQEEKSRLFCGTPSYMAPEIVGRKDYYGQNADVWALGILLYAMLCGKMPFKAYNDRELYRRIEKGSFTLPPQFHENLKTLINKMLDVNPRKRPSIKALLEDDWVCSSGILRSTTQNFQVKVSNESNSIDLDIIAGIVKII